MSGLSRDAQDDALHFEAQRGFYKPIINRIP